MGVQVFISYRREGGRAEARNLYDRLSLDGYNTFFDYDSLRAGRFNDQIFIAIEQAHDFILVLTKGALDRCVSESDWVRIELEYALSRGKHIVFFGDENFEFPEELPEKLKEIKNIEILPLNHNFYEESYIRLKKNLISRRRIRINKRTLIYLFSSIMLIAVLAILYCANISRVSSTLVNMSVEMYPCRYQEIDPRFEDSFLKNFSYQDSLDQNNKLHVFPIYASEPNYFHFPLIRARIISNQHRTVVFHSGILEIINYTDYTPDMEKGMCRDCDGIIQNAIYADFTLEYPSVVIPPKGLTVELPNFYRNVVRGETDDNFVFKLMAEESCQFDARLRLITSTDESLFSDYVHFCIYIPSSAVLNPN